jgi:hypothetical protein
MKTVPQNVQVSSPNQPKAFKVGKIGPLVDLLADKNYTFKERAVIREYACNALDSQRTAGNTSKIKIHLPTLDEPWFSCKDQGIGLSQYDIENTYSGISISTKANDPTQIGNMGIGTLAAYCQGDTFTVKSWYNGTLKTYSCFRDANKEPQVILLTEGDTEEPNGLEVIVSVNVNEWNKIQKYKDEAFNVFRWWNEDVLPEINDEAVLARCKDFRKSFTIKGKDYGISSNMSDLYAVMANVAYKIPYEVSRDFDIGGYIQFEIGTEEQIAFDTGRENLSLDNETIRRVNKKINEVKVELAKDAITEIEKQPTPFKKAVAAEKFRGGTIGELIGDSLNVYNLPSASSNSITVYKLGGRRRSTVKISRVDEVPFSRNESIKYELYSHKDRFVGRIKHYMKQQSDTSLRIVVLKDTAVKECLVDRDCLGDLDVMPKVPYTGGGRGSYSKVKTFVLNKERFVYNSFAYSNDWQEAEIDLQQQNVFVEINRWEIRDCKYNKYEIKRIMRLLGDDFPQVVALKTSFLKTKKFKESDFISFDDYIYDKVLSIIPSCIYSFNEDKFDNCIKLLQKLDSNDLSDDMKDVVEMYKKMSKETDTILLLNNCGFKPEVNNITRSNDLNDLCEDIVSKYPLLPHLFTSVDKKELASYLK